MKENPSVVNIIRSFGEYIIGNINETYERFNFNNKLLQEQDKNFEHFHADLKRMIETCSKQHVKSIMKDENLLRINDPVQQKELLKVID